MGVNAGLNFLREFLPDVTRYVFGPISKTKSRDYVELRAKAADLAGCGKRDLNPLKTTFSERGINNLQP
jgi:hypothetical protein